MKQLSGFPVTLGVVNIVSRNLDWPITMPEVRPGGVKDQTTREPDFMRFVAFALALTGAVAIMPVTAPAETPVVVELFTSQGCSSCPPADALMVKLVQREDVIGLALHVDYWDYIGWKDEFGDPAYTRRQKGYARAGARKMIYTPQMIIDGEQDVVGARAMEVVDLINQHNNKPRDVAVQVRRADGRVLIEVQPLSGPVAEAGPYDIHLVRYTPTRTSEITRGELAGRVLEYVNIVDDWTVLDQWDGKSATSLSAEIAGDRPVVVLIQGTDFGAILAAAQVK